MGKLIFIILALLPILVSAGPDNSTTNNVTNVYPTISSNNKYKLPGVALGLSAAALNFSRTSLALQGSCGIGGTNNGPQALSCGLGKRFTGNLMFNGSVGMEEGADEYGYNAAVNWTFK